jgi:hypothetical protein
VGRRRREERGREKGKRRTKKILQLTNFGNSIERKWLSCSVNPPRSSKKSMRNIRKRGRS